MIRSKVKALSYAHFLRYKYMGIFFFRRSRASNSEVNSRIWPKIYHVCDFMVVLVTCKFDEDVIKTEVAIV